MTDEELLRQFQMVQQSVSALIENVQDSLEREIADVKTSLESQIRNVTERHERMETRLDKIAAGSQLCDSPGRMVRNAG